MRICCCLTGHLELARRRDLYGSPVVVGDADGNTIAASDEARPFGVEIGMPVRQSEHLCPQATFLSSDGPAAIRLHELIAAALYDLAPSIEVRVDGIAWLDLEGVPSPAESIREARRRLRTAIGREPRLGLSSGPFSSRLAAARARPGRLLRIDDTRKFLAPLSARELSLEEEQMERLDLLGLRTLGAVASIGPRELESQLGRDGRRAVLLARGLEPDPLVPWQPPLFTSAHRQFEPPVEDREALLFVSRALCGDLAEELGLRGAGAKQMRVRLACEDGDIEARDSIVRHALSSTAELFGLVGSWIKGWQPHAPIVEMWIELPVLEVVGRRQLRLWTGGDGNSDEVTAALERLQERHGDDVVRKPRPLLPSSPIPAQRFA
jgi:nucleotidyltransferase/DNA polymerase involved in DNA repair